MNIEEQMLEERLQNWGRWNRDPKRQGRSPLCAFMEGAKNDENEGEQKPEEPHSELPPIDVKDALLVQKAWQKMPTCPERYRVAKIVLGVVYSIPGNFDYLCHHLRKYHRIRLRERDFEQLMTTGKATIKNVLRRIDRIEN